MKKLLVFMIDALCSSDIEYMKTLPNFSKIIENGSYVHHMLPVHPALTYCCHTSIVTGRYVDGHGITNNERLERGCRSTDVWFGMKSEIKAPTFLDEAMKYGLTTCSISWPVTGGADYTYNIPMIVPYHYDGREPQTFLEGTATQSLLDEYMWRFGRFLGGRDRSLDIFTMCVAPEIIMNQGQPDVMLVKMCDLDTVRHIYGVHNKEVEYQLYDHDEQLGVLLEAIRRYGDIENTNIVIMGDHGQTDIIDVLNINKVLADAGFIRYNSEGKITSCDAYAHSAGLTCFIELADPEDHEMEEKVRDFLNSLKEDPDIQLLYVLDKKEMKEQYHLEGPFDFVIESNRDISFAFDNNFLTDTIWESKQPGDHIIGAATHGSRPDRDETTMFIACGPSVRKGVVLETANMVDEAVTMSKMIGFDFNNTDGRLLTEILK